MHTAAAAARAVSLATIRAQFPALSGETVFLDNAGGSQVPRAVADAVRDYFLNDYVQLGADYDTSRRATAMVKRAHGFVEALMNAGPGRKAILGPSTSALCRMLADCYAQVLKPGDEVVICETGHESNLGPWARLAERGVVVRMWKYDAAAGDATIEGLKAVLSERTRLVAFPQVSNILGAVADVRAITDLCHSYGAKVMVDGVAYAPHRPIDLEAYGCDWYVYSTYKVYGPHMAVLCGTLEAIGELTGPNHYFLAKDYLPGKFELGGVNHEGCAGLVALDGYLRLLAGEPERGGIDEPFDTSVMHKAFALMSDMEMPLQARLIGALAGREGVRLLGPAAGDERRVPTIAFTHERRRSKEIAQQANSEGLGMRYGNFYAYRLCEALGLDPADGVVRVSLVHYNTMEEVDRVIGFFDRAL